MSNKVDYSLHPENPAAQPFQINGSKNKTKKNSWWNIHSSNYWRNRSKKKDTKKKDDDLL